MADTGYKFPTTTPSPGTGNAWTNPTNAYAKDGSFTVWNLTGTTNQDYGTYGFGVPAAATINGIQVIVTAKANSAGTMSFFLKGASSGIYKDIALTTTSTDYTLGGPTDLWGTTWVDGDFSDANFISSINAGSGSGGTLSGYPYSVDAIQVKVYYTPYVPPPPPPPKTPMQRFNENLNRVSFANLVNYLKIDSSSGSDTCPALGSYGNYTKTITHNLGYIPHFEIYQESAPGGAIVNSQVQVVTSMGSGSITSNYPNAMDFLGQTNGYAYVTSTQLIITMANNSNNSTPAFKFWWRIYVQYGGQT